MRNKKITKTIAESALIAAVYAAVTIVLVPFMSYGLVQFRIAEILVLLCFYNRKYIPALIVGCLIANIPNGIYDMVLGTAATAISVLVMSRIKNIWLAALPPVIFNAIIVGAMLTYVFELAPIYISAPMVGLGQFVVIVVIGVPLFKFGFERNKKFMELIRT
jgi:uncharacterized membrane protein